MRWGGDSAYIKVSILSWLDKPERLTPALAQAAVHMAEHTNPFVKLKCAKILENVPSDQLANYMDAVNALIHELDRSYADLDWAMINEYRQTYEGRGYDYAALSYAFFNAWKTKGNKAVDVQIGKNEEDKKLYWKLADVDSYASSKQSLIDAIAEIAPEKLIGIAKEIKDDISLKDQRLYPTEIGKIIKQLSSPLTPEKRTEIIWNNTIKHEVDAPDLQGATAGAPLDEAIAVATRS